MLRSMTGYGMAAIENESLAASATVRSVNHRYLDIMLHLGPGLVGAERGIRALVESRLRRGRVDVSVRATFREGVATRVDVSHPLVASMLDALREMQSRHQLPGTLTIQDLARMPGVLDLGETELKEEETRTIIDLISRAIDQLETMRRAEGIHLTDHVLRCLSAVEATAERIARLSAAERGLRQDALRERARGLVAELALDEARLNAEIARLVDRSEVVEEVERLRSHVALARQLADSAEATGKRLDFLAQELMREANTIGSKSASAPLTHEVVGLKGEIEQLREQVQNVE